MAKGAPQIPYQFQTAKDSDELGKRLTRSFYANQPVPTLEDSSQPILATCQTSLQVGALVSESPTGGVVRASLTVRATGVVTEIISATQAMVASWAQIWLSLPGGAGAVGLNATMLYADDSGLYAISNPTGTAQPVGVVRRYDPARQQHLCFVSPSLVTPGSGGAGTVTSVGLALPSSILTVSGSPVTTSGTLTGTLATQTANTVWAGPTTGAAAAPTFRAMVPADIPNTTVTPGTYGDSTHVGQFTVDAQGRLTGASSVAIAYPGGITGFANPSATATGAVINGSATTAMRSDAAPLIQLDAGHGGTGQNGGYAVGDILYASGAAALSKLADVAVGSVLVSGGVATAPAWSTTPQVARIGVGAAAAASPVLLYVSGSISGAGKITARFENTNSAGGTSNQFYNDTGLKGFIETYGSAFTVSGLRNVMGVWANGQSLFLGDGSTSSGGSQIISMRPTGYGTETARFSGTGLGIGTTPSVPLHVLKTTEQLRLAYDATHYCSFTVDSAGALTISAPVTFSSTVTYNGAIVANTTSLTPYLLTVTEASASPAVWDYYRLSASPVANDQLFDIAFNGNNASAAKKEYASILASILDTTAGSEDGQIDLRTMIGGTLTTATTINATGLTLNSSGIFSVGVDPGLTQTVAVTDFFGGEQNFGFTGGIVTDLTYIP